jgi:glycine betaine/proline transport system ATP-binding protein
MTTAIEIKNLIKIFGPRSEQMIPLVKNGVSKEELINKHGHVLGLVDINMSVPAGEILVVMGLSGSGKSTLIRHINRLIEPSEGEILFDGNDITKLNKEDLRKFRQKRTSMVFQKFGLLPHRSVEENVAYGLELQGVPVQSRLRTANEWIERVGLKGYGQRFPHQLSGGMQQRVGLARALANNSDILLMDEAYSALDPLIRVDMQNMLLELQRELKKTVIFITHDLDEALKLGNKIVILREGKINQEGTGQDIVLRPANDYVASFVKEVNRARVLTLSNVLGPVISENLELNQGLTLHEATKVMVKHGKDIASVVDDRGNRVGSVDCRSIMAIVADERPCERLAPAISVVR